MIQKVKVEEFLELAGKYPVLDVRSPGEYVHAHIPGAYNLPLFSDEERKIVGTTYKQESREQAIKVGLDFFGVKMRKMVEEAEHINAGPTSADPVKCVLVHCWRGGMRSAGVAWLLDMYGFKVYTLAGGYKAFRNFVLQQFDKPYQLQVIGGYTGAGKTDLLKQLASAGHTIIDLEGIAHHKGSAFGAFGQPPQPKPEMFENVLACELYHITSKLGKERAIWIEDESRRIGDINMPKSFWETMRAAPVFFLDVPFEVRLDHITKEYGKSRKEDLVNAIMRIQKRLGYLAAKNAINFLLEDNYRECFRVLLQYYDKFYSFDIDDRKNTDHQIEIIHCTGTDAAINMQKLAEVKQMV